MEALLRDLDRIEAGLDLPARTASNGDWQTAGLLRCTRRELKAMTPEDLHEGAVLLQNYAFFLQREANRHKAVVDWCESNIQFAIADLVSSQRGMHPTERRPQAVRRDEAARRLTAIKVRSQAALTTVSYLAQRAERQADHFGELGRTKARKLYGTGRG